MRQPDEVIAAAFDTFCAFLRDKSLGCRWEFVSYLLFLMRSDRFFPIRSSYFERVLNYWDIETRIQAAVHWANYKLILDTAEAVRERLLEYGTPTALELQSYMWVVSYLIPDLNDTEQPQEYDFSDILQKRRLRANEKQRIGLQGEKYVLEYKKQRLGQLGESELAERVRLVAEDDESAGYDVLSFAADGRELHIEVKATVQPRHDQDCFWLSQNEVEQAESDQHWRLWRVWQIDSEPHHEDLGNIVTSPAASWERSAASWLVRRGSTAD